VQIIRAASILQLLLGNVGGWRRLLALRRPRTIQGSSRHRDAFNIHPGYLNTPSALRRHER